MPNHTSREFFRVSDIADRDLEYLTELRKQIDSPSLGTTVGAQDAIRRLYVRVFITMIEGSISTIKTETLQYEAKLTDAERAILRDVTFDLNDKGEPYERALHPPMLSSIRFAFRIFARVHGLATKPDYSGLGWQSLIEVVRLRNRLTHPKTVLDLTVTDSDLETVDEAELWFLRTHRALLEEYNSNMQSKFAALAAKTGA